MPNVENKVHVEESNETGQTAKIKFETLDTNGRVILQNKAQEPLSRILPVVG